MTSTQEDPFSGIPWALTLLQALLVVEQFSESSQEGFLLQSPPATPKARNEVQGLVHARTLPTK